ncbi:MAG: hypothetical protein NDF55_00365 [archaeon GB-1867-005]|nr:hypothetical protein [Candidatus Culexmicrobium cathedralense]
MSRVYTRDIPLIITTLTAVFIILDGVLEWPEYNAIAGSVTQSASVIASLTILISTIALARIHIYRVIKRRRGWVESLMLLGIMFTTIIVGFGYWAIGILPGDNPVLSDLYDAFLTPGDATIFSLLCFFIASAAYRAFRARTLESTLLLTAGIIVMLGKIPLGELIWSGLPPLAHWLLDVPNKAGARVIMISATLATVALYIRTLLGYERGWMGRVREGE